MKIALTIPLYHSSELLSDFTRQTLESIKSENHELYIYLIVNYSLPEFYPKQEDFVLDQSIKQVTIIDNPKGNEVGAAWNLGIKIALEQGCEYVMVLNNDLVLHHSCIDNLLTFADMHPEFILWSASEWVDIRTINGIKEAEIKWDFSEHPHFSYFMVNQKTIDTVGWFDENLRMAYMEDGEMHYRIVLSGNKAGKTEAAKFYHYGSRTIKVDDDLFDKNKRSYEDNRAYILRKWNLDFHGKVFVPPESMMETGYHHPYNKDDLTWKYWEGQNG